MGILYKTYDGKDYLLFVSYMSHNDTQALVDKLNREKPDHHGLTDLINVDYYYMDKVSIL